MCDVKQDMLHTFSPVGMVKRMCCVLEIDGNVVLQFCGGPPYLESGGDVKMLLHVSPQNLTDAAGSYCDAFIQLSHRRL